MCRSHPGRWQSASRHALTRLGVPTCNRSRSSCMWRPGTSPGAIPAVGAAILALSASCIYLHEYPHFHQEAPRGGSAILSPQPQGVQLARTIYEKSTRLLLKDMLDEWKLQPGQV